MAKKAPNNKKPDAHRVTLGIDWQSPDSAPAIFANNLLIQSGDEELYLNFYDIAPPLILADSPEEMRESLAKLKDVKARCVARIAISGGRTEVFLTAIQAALKKYRSPRASRDRAEGE